MYNIYIFIHVYIYIYLCVCLCPFFRRDMIRFACASTTSLPTHHKPASSTSLRRQVCLLGAIAPWHHCACQVWQEPLVIEQVAMKNNPGPIDDFP